MVWRLRQSTEFQHTAARRRLARSGGTIRRMDAGFNTQPPEGGWTCGQWWFKTAQGFQHTAARRRLAHCDRQRVQQVSVSTHSRPKAAGDGLPRRRRRKNVSTHSRPKAAGRRPFLGFLFAFVSTHSRPKAAG